MNFLGAGLGLVAPVVANALGIGKNKTRAKTFDESKAYDANAFQYGGHAGVADQTANRFAGLGAGAEQRQGAQADYTNANGWQNASSDDRNGQNQAANMMMARAQGLVPSISQMQGDRQMQQATAAQASAAASARGAGGLALAGQNAANNTATMQSAISNQTQINAAQERLAAEQGAYGAYSGIRGADQAQQGMAAQQSQYNAGLQQQQQGMNDAYSLGMYNQEAGVRAQQLQGSMYQQGLLGNSQTNATNQNIAISQNNANREYDYYKQAMGGAQGGVDAATKLAPAGGGIAPPAGGGGGGGTPPLQQFRASGGPVSAGRPYVVGERGPELIIPSRNGMVLPAEHPASRMAAFASDDRAKFGMSPLGLLGMGGGDGYAPGTGHGVGGGTELGASGGMTHQDLMAAGSGLSSPGGGIPGMVGGGGVTGGYVNTGENGGGGGMGGGGLLSDDRAKRAAYLLGRADGMQSAQSDEPAPNQVGAPLNDGEELVMGRNGPEIRPTTMGLLRALPKPAPQSGSIDRDAQYYAPARSQPAASPSQQGSMFDRDAAQAPAQPVGRHYSSDPVTEQFAEGLAPIRFQYKPGMGPAGEQTGVRAQAAASQPVTASMIAKRPDGLLQIDPQMGLSTALAGVGHLAKKQKEQEARLEGLLAMTARREGY